MTGVQTCALPIFLDKHFSYYSVDTKGIEERFENCELCDLVFITAEYLVPYLTFIRENQRLFKVAIKRFNAMSMEQVYGKMFTHIFNPILARFRVPERERPYVIKFYLTGIFAIVMEWLDKNCEDDMETVAQIIVDCVLGERSVRG